MTSQCGRHRLTSWAREEWVSVVLVGEKSPISFSRRSGGSPRLERLTRGLGWPPVGFWHLLLNRSATARESASRKATLPVTTSVTEESSIVDGVGCDCFTVSSPENRERFVMLFMMSCYVILSYVALWCYVAMLLP